MFAVRPYRPRKPSNGQGNLRPARRKFNEAKLRWRVPNGARIGFAYLEREVDADMYQGHNYTDLDRGDRAISELCADRSAIRCAAVRPRRSSRLVLTANPGGPGHQWVRERYGLNPFPRGPKIITGTLPNGQLQRVGDPVAVENDRMLMSAI